MRNPTTSHTSTQICPTHSPPLQSRTAHHYLQSHATQTIAFAVDEAVFRSQQQEKGWSEARWVAERETWRAERREDFVRREEEERKENSRMVRERRRVERRGYGMRQETGEVVDAGEDETMETGTEERLVVLRARQMGLEYHEKCCCYLERGFCQNFRKFQCNVGYENF